jgi:hypothetical protein
MFFSLVLFGIMTILIGKQVDNEIKAAEVRVTSVF